MDPNEKLTIQALKEHDKVHPKFKASITSNSGSRDKRDGSKVSVGGASTKKSPLSDAASRKSDSTAGRGPRAKINIFRLVAATRAWQRLAKSRSSREKDKEKVKPVVRYENTYRLEPADGQNFKPDKVNKVLEDTLEANLSGEKYSAEKCRRLASHLTNVIRERVKTLGFPRYKLVCNVFITENKEQGMEIASRCVWNQHTDGFTSYTYRNGSMIAVANVHAVYFE